MRTGLHDAEAPPAVTRRAPLAGRQVNSRVLLVGPDLASRAPLERALLLDGLALLAADGLAQAQAALTAHTVCLILFSPRLAPEDGWSVFRHLRSYGVPIVVLVPPGDQSVTRLALTLGAEDCVSEHGSPADIATRVRFVLQRSRPRPSQPQALGQIALEPGVGARVNGQLVPLTPTECGLLAALVEAQGRVVEREQLVVRARAQAGAFPLARSIDGHVRSLRRKLGDDLDEPRLVLTARGFGYRLAPTPAQPALGLADAVLQALPEAILVVDERQQIKFMNRAAERLTGHPAPTAIDCLSCSALLNCRLDQTDCDRCPWLVTRTTGAPRATRLTIAPGRESLTVKCTATQLADDDRVLLRVREVIA